MGSLNSLNGDEAPQRVMPTFLDFLHSLFPAQWSQFWNLKSFPKKSAASARAKILAQWRGVDLSSQEVARTDAARPVGAVLPKLMADLKLDSRRAEAELIKVWNALMDPVVTAHAQPAGLHKGTLFVNVDSNAWLAEIVRYRRKEILERLQNSFGPITVKKISYRVG